MAMSTTISDSAIIVCCLVLFGAGGLLLEQKMGLDPVLSSIRSEAGPAGTSAGRLGRIARQLQIDGRAVNSLLMAPETLPSSLVIDVGSLDPGWPVLSIVADVVDLNDPEHRILSNPRGRGREWERIAYASYYDQGELIFATRAGLRRHGGASRKNPVRPSLRLYFRDDYGSEYSGQAILEEVGASPTRIVVRRTALFLATAFEVARQIGAPTPVFKLAQLYLNGEREGPYLLTEHVHRDGWGRSHFGRKPLSMFVFRGTVPTDESSTGKFAELDTWARDLPAPVTMETLEASIDLDNMFLNIFTFVYCGTGDWAQGAIVRDESRIDSRWFGFTGISTTAFYFADR